MRTPRPPHAIRPRPSSHSSSLARRCPPGPAPVRAPRIGASCRCETAACQRGQRAGGRLRCRQPAGALRPARSLPAARAALPGDWAAVGVRLPRADAVVGLGAGRIAGQGLYLVTTCAAGRWPARRPGDVRREAGELTAQAADVLTDPPRARSARRPRGAFAAGVPGRQPPASAAAVVQGQPVRWCPAAPVSGSPTTASRCPPPATARGAQVRLAGDRWCAA